MIKEILDNYVYLLITTQRLNQTYEKLKGIKFLVWFLIEKINNMSIKTRKFSLVKKGWIQFPKESIFTCPAIYLVVKYALGYYSAAIL